MDKDMDDWIAELRAQLEDCQNVEFRVSLNGRPGFVGDLTSVEYDPDRRAVIVSLDETPATIGRRGPTQAGGRDRRIPAVKPTPNPSRCSRTRSILTVRGCA